MATTYRIRDWKKRFENSESRKLQNLKWVAMPNKMNTNGYTALVSHPNGAAHLGAWCAIVEICSAREPKELRGMLPESDGTIGGISRALGRISRLPPEIFQQVLPRLLSDPDILWIEALTDESGDSPETSGENPETSGANRIGLEGIGLEGKTTTAPGSAQLPRLPSQSEYPLTTEAIRKHDPGVDDIFVRRLVATTIQACLSDDAVPPEEVDKVTDDILADAVSESFQKFTGRNGHGVGLLLSRVPQIVRGWAKET